MQIATKWIIPKLILTDFGPSVKDKPKEDISGDLEKSLPVPNENQLYLQNKRGLWISFLDRDLVTQECYSKGITFSRKTYNTLKLLILFLAQRDIGDIQIYIYNNINLVHMKQ